MSEFLSMNGYGFYIWGSYGLGLVLLGALFALTLLRKAKLNALQKDIETP